ncbi:PDZ and LIM domain protein 3b isoform X3 [Conger conger]|uniref:PDZ and LIM domain protein 3b isoform X3 n=1 Tax=Conger conger TaxID=82655 RepID=UPI002A5A0BED|nr:PDZ and LIM domain protein 3b isoform X3 [Conger conger]
MPQNVVLQGPGPWGFRLVGGKDFNQPLSISRITPGSKASLANLCPGDIILTIEGDAAEGLTHGEAQNKIKDSSLQLNLKIERPETKLWSPQVTEEGRPSNPFKINLEAEQQDLGYFEHKFNVRPKPFTLAGQCSTKPQGPVVKAPKAPGIIPPPDLPPAPNSCPGEAWVPSAQYNSPIRLYSDANVMNAQQQAQMSSVNEELPHSASDSGALGSIEESHVYRMLQDNPEAPHEPRQSGSFKALQEYVESDGTRPIPVTRSVKAPVTKSPGAATSVQKLPLCDKCGKGIVGTVVKARDKFRHPGCFVCSDCDMNLKQKGYFFVEGQLYCEAHARARSRPPEGHEAVTVYPNA